MKRNPAAAVDEIVKRLRSAGPIAIGEIARDAGYRSITTLKRDLGILKQPARTNTGQPVYNHELDVDVAGRIVRALGVNPCDVPAL